MFAKFLKSHTYSFGSLESKKQTYHGVKLHLSKFHHAEHRHVLKPLSELDDLKNEARVKGTESKISLD